ncbi:MAG: methylglyoxal synthase [Flavobacteriales bacterium]|nr:methylglyoxal synthase [Flavobacteriales bacterium]
MLKNIAVVAHNKMKPELVNFLKEKEPWFWGRNIVSTGLTGTLLKSELNLNITPLSPGKEGGFNELRELVDKGEVKMVLFFRDPEIVQEYEDEVIDFLKSCNLKNIPLATNPSSAELIILGLIKKEAAEKTKSKAREFQKDEQ